MKKILVTTTDSLYGWEIVNYIKPVYSNLIVGSNFFRDFGASLTDLFGGRATLYEKNIQMLNEKAVEKLSAKALEVGANCILGMKVDIDEISGKNMQMFMVTAWGTAVTAKNSSNPLSSTNTKEIDKEKINEQANIIRLASASLESNFKLTLKDLQIIVDTKSPEFKDILFNRYKNLNPGNFSDEDLKIVTKLYSDYFAGLDHTLLIPLIYNELLNGNDELFTDKLLNLIKENDLVDYNYVEPLLHAEVSKKKLALKVLRYDKPYYSSEDIPAIEKVINNLDSSFPLLSTSGTKKGFLSSAEKEAWICKCGKTNDIGTTYCSNCMKDAYGFREAELNVKTVKTSLTNKLLALKSLL
jgi:uncharacterized protein YbjQ (UPF0145 family)